MENTEIVYVCNSTNNKNVRANELKILEKHPEQLYFVFGESNENAKKRIYNNLETLEKDFKALSKIKKELQKSEKDEIVPIKEVEKVEIEVEPEPKKYKEEILGKKNNFEKKS